MFSMKDFSSNCDQIRNVKVFLYRKVFSYFDSKAHWEIKGETFSKIFLQEVPEYVPRSATSSIRICTISISW